MPDEELNTELKKNMKVNQSSLVGGSVRRKENILVSVIQGQNEAAPRAAE